MIRGMRASCMSRASRPSRIARDLPRPRHRGYTSRPAVRETLPQNNGAKLRKPSRSNRRITARKACLLTVRYQANGDWRPATAMDLSPYGCRLRVGEDVPAASTSRSSSRPRSRTARDTARSRCRAPRSGRGSRACPTRSASTSRTRPTPWEASSPSCPDPRECLVRRPPSCSAAPPTASPRASAQGARRGGAASCSEPGKGTGEVGGQRALHRHPLARQRVREGEPVGVEHGAACEGPGRRAGRP